METEKRLLLKATEHNWGLQGPGDWKEMEWRVFTDGSFERTATFNPGFGDLWDDRDSTAPTRSKTTSRMREEAFAKLREAIASEPWRDPALEVFACDGVAWQIESYREDGSVDKTSGKIGYIYGHTTLETIVSLLPAGDRYGASAFISVGRKDR